MYVENFHVFMYLSCYILSVIRFWKRLGLIQCFFEAYSSEQKIMDYEDFILGY